MRSWMALLAMVPACGFQSSEAKDGGGGSGTPDALLCFGSFVKVCFDSPSHVPTTAKMWTDDVDVDTDATDTSSLCDQNNNQKGMYCVVAGTGMTLADMKKLRGHGSKSLILLSTMPIDLEGIIDVSSNRNLVANKGAGADPSGSCTGAATVAGYSGGAGGSFAGQGGDGQRLNTNTTPIAAPKLSKFPGLPRGGCPGGTGAVNDAVTGGTGGSGGGAVAIIAPSITINGEINASGAGGGGGPPTKSGGGGGGSGGMIVLDIPMAGITRGSNGVLFANGGGGGEGGSDDPMPSGTAGQDGSAPTSPTPAALGGSSSSNGGNGGPGSSGPDTAGGNSSGQSSGAGGGGAGGGGPGFIHAPGITDSTAISPASQDLP